MQEQILNGTAAQSAREEEIRRIIQAGRDFIKMPPEAEEEENEAFPGYKTDQEQKKQQPPLYKKASGGHVTPLPSDYGSLTLNNSILSVLFARKSSRIYTDEPITLLQLSFLLWATQGVKSIRGNNYATLRTVPCGGARHEFECYLAVRNVEGLVPGYYHYMPDRHALELLSEGCQDDDINASLCGQRWALKANAVMYYSVIPYRAEWRYGIYAHRTILIDAGHITENLYIACSASDLGTCAVAAVDTAVSDRMFALDGNEEYIFYAAPVGTVSPVSEKEEAGIYAFLKDEKGAASP